MASDKVGNVTDSSFDSDVLKSAQPVLIDFWATWCAPCRAIAPVVEQLAGEDAGKVKVVKLNVDDNPIIATKYEVRSIPTLLMIKGGNVVGQLVGAVPRPKIEELIKKAL